MSAIPESPNKYETIKQILMSIEEIMHELELGFIFLEVDQAIYHKILDVKFQFPDQFQSVIVRMGGFHVIICLMRSIYSRFRGFGLVELLSAVVVLVDQEL